MASVAAPACMTEATPVEVLKAEMNGSGVSASA
jgi:hypothetical protein